MDNTSNKKLLKLQKLRNLSNDMSTTESERKLAYQRYVEFKEKYNLEFLEEKEERYFIRASNFYENVLLTYILMSFEVESYSQKRCSKNKIIFYCKKSTYQAIKDDFEFHSKNLYNILFGTTVKYLHTQIKPPLNEDSETSEKPSYSKEFLKAYFGNEWLNKEEYKNRIKIGE